MAQEKVPYYGPLPDVSVEDGGGFARNVTTGETTRPGAMAREIDMSGAARQASEDKTE